MEILDKYLKLQDKIYEYFGYVEDWCVFPIEDSREYYWYINEHIDEVLYAHCRKNVVNGTMEDGYSDEIYHNRFLPKAVYCGEDYTMVLVDTLVDGNKFLRIFDNAMQLSEEDYEKLCDCE